LNFEIFLFLLFMSFVSFAVGVIVWVAIMRFFGQGSRNARILSYILIPIFAWAIISWCSRQGNGGIWSALSPLR